jgi:DNA polymerase III subunit beta
MRLQVTQENFAKALGSVARVANSRNALPILSNILLRTVDNRLSISATNLDIAITHHIGSKIAEKGSITVPARLTQDFVNSLPSGVINLELDGHKLHITTEKYQSTINGVIADEFPVMPAMSNPKEWVLPAKESKKALQQVIVAASSDDARPVLTGVYLHSFEGSLYAVATDSYRLAEKRLTTTKDEVSLLVPATAVSDLLRIIPDQEADLFVSYDEQQVLFKSGDVELVTRLIEGAYPDYRKLIPAKFTTSALLKRDDFVNISKVSSLFARESAGSITLQVDEAAQVVRIVSIASQLGENTSEAAAKVTGGGEVTLNSRYLLEALATFHGEEVSFSFNGKLEPCVLRSTTEPDYTHIVMPLRS